VLDGERRVALSQLLGERLAERYQLPIGSNAPFGLDDAVGAYLGGNRDSQRLYRVVNDLMGDVNPPAPPALCQLAEISDFHLFVSTTFDSLLTRAINETRFEGETRARDLWFSPNQSTVATLVMPQPGFSAWVD
jgi:hypothetical protein